MQIYDNEKNSISTFDYGLTEITKFYIGDSIALASFIDGQDIGLIKWVYLIVSFQWQLKCFKKFQCVDIKQL